jgi:hypothetical protein
MISSYNTRDENMKVYKKVKGTLFDFEIESVHISVKNTIKLGYKGNAYYTSLMLESLLNIIDFEFTSRDMLIQESKLWEKEIEERYANIIKRNWKFDKYPLIRELRYENNIYVDELRIPPFWTNDYTIRLYFTYNIEQTDLIYLLGQKKNWSERETTKFIEQAAQEAKAHYEAKGWL